MDVERSNARHRGLTLVELLSTLSVGTVLLAAGLPLWAQITDNNTLAEARNQMRGMLSLARSTAVTRAQPAAICPTRDQTRCSRDHTAWAEGYMLFIDSNGDRLRDHDEPIVRVINSKRAGLAIHTSRGRKTLRFNPDGSAWGSNVTLRFCGQNQRNNSALIVTGSGRIRASEQTASGDPVSCPPD